MSSPVLIISTSVDSATDEVVAELENRDIPVVRFNTELYPFNSSLFYQVNSEEIPRLQIKKQNNFRSIWYRKVRVPERPLGMDEGHFDFCLEESRYALVGAILALSETVPTISNPKTIWAAEHKPYQLSVAKSCGFIIPETLIGNNSEKVVEAFGKFKGKLIAKPVRTGYLEEAGKPKAIYTSAIKPEHMEQIQRVEVCPSIFQPLLDKQFDIRVTIVGDKVFTAEIDSQTDFDASVDWRKTSNPNLPHRNHNLPKQIHEKLLLYMNKLGLKFGTIDFVLTKSGEYVFLEINPSGQWLWLDRILGFGITKSIADWLEKPMGN